MSDTQTNGAGNAAATATRSAFGMAAIGRVLAAIVIVRLVTLGSYPILDPSEGRYTLIGANMVLTGNWVVPLLAPDMPYLAKPPLSFWLTALSFSTLGINEFAARLPVFLLSLAVGALVFLFGADERGRRFGLIAACIFASMGYIIVLSGSVMPDVTFMFAVTLAMVSFWKCLAADSRGWGYLFFIAVAASLLTKGPVGAVLIGLPICGWLFWQRRWRAAFARLPWLTGGLLALALTLPWYVLAERRSPGFLNYFIVGEHIQRYLDPTWPDRYGRGVVLPLGFIWVFAFVAMLPWSVVAIIDLVRGRRAVRAASDPRDPWLSYLLFWVAAQLLFFSVPRIVLISYVAPALPALALLVAYVLEQTGAAQRYGALVAWSSLAPAAAVAAIAVAIFKPDAAFIPSQFAVVKLKEAVAKNSDAPLIYPGAAVPFSASLYTRGRASQERDWSKIERQVANQETYVALSLRSLPRVPESLRQELALVGTANGFLLFRAIPHAP